MSTAPRKRAAKKTTAAAPTKPESGADILARVQPQRRVESTMVCLRADLVAQFHEADAVLAQLRAEAAASGNRLASGARETDEMRKQARVVRKLEQQIVDAQVTFTFTGMRKDEFRALCDDHPPRKGNHMDHMVGYDREAVVEAMVRQSLTAPTFEDCTDRECEHADCGTWQQLISVINPSEWGELRDTANLANSSVVDAPKSVLASQILDRRSSASV